MLFLAAQTNTCEGHVICYSIWYSVSRGKKWCPLILNSPLCGIPSLYRLILPTINQHTKFEMLRFTLSKDMTGPKIENIDHVTPTTPFWGGLSHMGLDLP